MIVMKSIYIFAFFSSSAATIITNLPGNYSLPEQTITEILLHTLAITDPAPPSVVVSLGPATTGTGASKFRVRHLNGTSTYGIFTVANSFYNITAEPTFILQINAVDNTTTDTGNFTVNLVASQPPTITNLPGTATINVNASIGHQVFQVTSTDAEGDQILYSFTCSPTGCETWFNIYDLGQIKLVNDISAIQASTITFNVTVRDSRYVGDTKTLTVNVTGINSIPTITNLNTSINVAENIALGTTIETATCTDNDTTDSKAISMSCLPTWGSSLIGIHDTTGVITTITPINYESLTAPTTFVCSIECTDSTSTSTSTLNVTITDVPEAPTYPQNSYNEFINESLAGTQIQSSAYNVSDDDNGDTRTYTLNCGAYTNYFSVDATNGIMKLARDVDADNSSVPTSIICSLTATDKANLTGTVTVNVTIININDNIPKFSPLFYAFTVWRHWTTDMVIGTVTATDGDLGTYGNIVYSVDSSTLSCGCININNAGQLLVNNNLLALNASSTVIFNVVATDGGGKQATAQVSLIVREIVTQPVPVRYLKFTDDRRNIAWLTISSLIFACSLVFGAYLIYSAKTANSASQFQCCRVFFEKRQPPTDEYYEPPHRVFPQVRPTERFY
ncbi:plasma membrane adhesion molecule [Mactra antiquata]